MKMTLMVSSVNKINMARNRIKVHPFGYKNLRGSDKEKRFGHQIDKDNIQLVKMKVPYQVPVRKNGKYLFTYTTDENGKKHRVFLTETFFNTITKVIYHNIDAKPKKGRSLADMVYESYKA